MSDMRPIDDDEPITISNPRFRPRCRTCQYIGERTFMLNSENQLEDVLSKGLTLPVEMECSHCGGRLIEMVVTLEFEQAQALLTSDPEATPPPFPFSDEQIEEALATEPRLRRIADIIGKMGEIYGGGTTFQIAYMIHSALNYDGMSDT